MLIKLENKYPTNYHFPANSSWNVVEARRSEKPSKAAKRWLEKTLWIHVELLPASFPIFHSPEIKFCPQERNFVAQQGAAEFRVATINHFSKPDFRWEILAQVNEIPCAYFAVPPDGRWVRLMTEASLVRAVRNWNRSRSHNNNNGSVAMKQKGKRRIKPLEKVNSTKRKKMFLIFLLFHFFNDDA